MTARRAPNPGIARRRWLQIVPLLGAGLAADLALAQSGQPLLEETDDEIQKAGGSATLVPMNLRDFDAIDRRNPISNAAGQTRGAAIVPPPLTALMVLRAVEGHGLDHRWRSLNQISPNLPRAVVAAEDARFCEHHGFDFEAMEKAMDRNARGGRLRGGSTISQQTAKNVFL